ncbi:Hercynine oxygenase [Gracilariopsis chorda]|uniref:Hercynine oxygenase n=1 Tax=Gracilariopsis chorda TaxID=448386 RepID=A0A2V3IUN2_9FLOR|nr:Hercynine oxygenase [Gracilariopsis chorda]|eukprot:PXF45821.1 Hercynine oxygenase [Gracilariopsis chorda]
MSAAGYEISSKALQHALKLIVEHEHMHLETLKYMLAQTHVAIFYPLHHAEAIECEKVQVQSGTVIPGVAKREGYASLLDNEHDTKPRYVKPFVVEKYAVTNSQYLQFINAGGYEEKSLWDDHWNWIKNNGIQMPATWRKRGDTYEVSYVPTEQDEDSDIAERPVIVSIAEAKAYANWKGARLPTEEEWIRAAVRDAEEPLFDRGWLPVHKGSESWSGVVGLCGNGWEITSTLFESFEGFEPSILYPLYSEEFFDGNHYVLKGASPFTDPFLSRTSFRNFFQPCYRYLMAKFRLAWDEKQ